MTKRYEIKLNESEQNRYNNLRGTVGVAWQFWEDICKERRLDYRTVYTHQGKTTALAIGHEQDWCYPHNIKCTADADEVYRELRAKGEVN